MSPRPRRVSDAAILNAAFKVVGQTGPDQFTLADVGNEVGLSAATLVQRFGSKRLLLLAMLQQVVGLVSHRFLEKVDKGQSPLETLYAAALERTDPTHGPENIANILAFLLMEINDPDFQAIAEASAREAVDTYKLMLDNAIEAGELSPAGIDTQHLAESIHGMTLGSLMMRVIFRDTESRTRTRRDLDTLLRSFINTPRLSAGLSENGSNENGSKPRGPSPLISAADSLDWQL